eukprot:3471188-Rhodomonas_salina.3
MRCLTASYVLSPNSGAMRSLRSPSLPGPCCRMAFRSLSSSCMLQSPRLLLAEARGSLVLVLSELCSRPTADAEAEVVGPQSAWEWLVLKGSFSESTASRSASEGMKACEVAASLLLSKHATVCFQNAQAIIASGGKRCGAVRV